MNRVAVSLVYRTGPCDKKLDDLRIVTVKTIDILWRLVNDYKHAYTHKLCMGVILGEQMSSFPDEQKLIQMTKQSEFNIIFVDEPGRCWQNGNTCVVYIAALSEPDLIVSIAHELCHSLGCFHSTDGVMAGQRFPDSEESLASSIDEISLTVLSYGPMFNPKPNPDNEFKYKVAGGTILIRCTESIRLVVFSRQSMYDELIEITEPAVQLELEPHLSDRLTCIAADGSIFCFTF